MNSINSLLLIFLYILLLKRWEGQSELYLRDCESVNIGLWDRMKGRTDGSKKDVANKRGRPEKSASVREKRSTEKWKIEDVPAAKKIGVRIWRDENDISKNLERTMSKNATETRNTKRKNVENCERETKEAGLKNGDGNLYGAFYVTRDFPSDFSSLNTICALREWN